MLKVGILGYGYTASYFASLLVSEGHKVWGTTRRRNALQQRVAPGVEITEFNYTDISRCMLDTSCLLICAPPDESGMDPTLSLLRELIIANKKQVQWIGYLSSTGVYGDHQGGWVNEKSPCYPRTQRATNRLSAENAWLSLCKAEGLPVMIFRLSGIYGPGRNALEKQRAGKSTTLFKKGQYFSRIHVADICAALRQSMISPMPGEIVNLSDDYPSSPQEVDCYAAHLLQIEKPRLQPYEEANLSLMAKEFYESNRRVDNTKLKKTLLPHLTYPTYKEGLQAIFKTSTW